MRSAQDESLSLSGARRFRFFRHSLPIAAGVLALALVASLAGIVRGGSLDPPGVPASTFKTLDDLPRAWNRDLPSSGADPCNTERFRCVLDGSAVLDRETGLVWERTISATFGTATWEVARDVCVGKLAGGRFGWRLPTVNEFRSIVDGTQASPALPAGHPFVVAETLTAASFWTVTTDIKTAVNGFVVSMSDGVATLSDKGNGFRHWCVRGAPFE